MVSHCPIENLDILQNISATSCGVTDATAVNDVLTIGSDNNYALYHRCPNNTRGRYVYLIDTPNIDLCEMVVHGQIANVTEFDGPADICGKCYGNAAVVGLLTDRPE